MEVLRGAGSPDRPDLNKRIKTVPKTPTKQKQLPQNLFILIPAREVSHIANGRSYTYHGVLSRSIFWFSNSSWIKPSTFLREICTQ